MKYLKLLLHLWLFMSSHVYGEASDAVKQVSKDFAMQTLGQKEGRISFCPRCGQRPGYDVRHDEAFEIAFSALKGRVSDRELHFAIELVFWLGKGH